MKIIKIIASLLVSIVVLLSFTGCFDYSYIDETADSITSTSKDTSKNTTDEIKLNIPYIASDSLNPFESKSEINRAITPLLFDSLFKVDNSFKAVNIIAKSYTLKDKKLIVTIRDDLKFSDLGGISSNDVVSSFDAAKKSERYKNSLSEIKSAVSTGTYTIEFEVDKNNSDICSLLTFPIVKTGTEAAGEGKADVPTGSGRYILTQTINNELYLTANQNRLNEYTPNYKNIGLFSASDEASVVSAFSLGHTNVLIDDFSDGNYKKYIGASNKQYLTNIVYLVCNSNNKIFDDVNVKKAISYALDRNEISDFAFIGYATPAYTPIHPDHHLLKDYDISKLENDTQLANDILDSIGYTNINPQYNFRYTDGRILEFDLAVNKENAFKLSAAQLIKEQLSKIKIVVNLKLYSQEDFLKAVNLGNYDMYLGECKLSDSFDLSVFFSASSSVSKGIPNNLKSEEEYDKFVNDGGSISEFLDTFNSEMPFIPVLYRCASINSNSAMAVSADSIVSDYYYNIDKWKNVND